MKLSSVLLAIFCVLLSTACLKQECRDCEGFNYDAAAFNPDFGDAPLVFENVATGESVTFEPVRVQLSMDQRVCSTEADDEDDISCITSASAAFRVQDLGVDMFIGFEENDFFGPRAIDQVITSFEFKAMDATQFIRTHALIIEPSILLVEGAVELRDTITLGDSTYTEVLDIIQPAEAFANVGDNLPRGGRFTNLYFRENTGLVGMRNVGGDLFVRR